MDPRSDSQASSWKISLGILAICLYFWKWRRNVVACRGIPTLGPSAPILSLYGAIRYLFHAKEMHEEGWQKFRGRPYKIARFSRWLVIITNQKAVEELYSARENELSALKAISETLGLEYTTRPFIADPDNQYHHGIIRTTLTQELGALSKALGDEVSLAFSEAIPLTNEWSEVALMNSIKQVVAGASCRAFVGLPFCRNREFLDIAIQYTSDVIVVGMSVSLLPQPMRVPAVLWASRLPRLVRRATEILGPAIKERMQRSADSEHWNDKPNDLLQWLIDSEDALGKERTAGAFTKRVLHICFAALHTTSMSFVYAILRLAANPQYMQSLREEVEAILQQEGSMSMAALVKMRKIDSFLKECQRLDVLDSLTLMRLALRNYTFSDGTTVPAGAFVAVAKASSHFNDAIYDDPYEFNPWRFLSLVDKGEEGTRHQMSHITPEYLPFSIGLHECPGRFFVAQELKIMLAHVVLHYDVSLKEPGKIPSSIAFTNYNSPSDSATALFRKRQT